jgi:hypothetical protein
MILSFLLLHFDPRIQKIPLLLIVPRIPSYQKNQFLLFGQRIR